MIDIRRVLFPTDLSDISRRAFGHALTLARFYQAEIELAYVVEPVGPAPAVTAAHPPFAVLDPEARGRLESELAELSRPARELANRVRGCNPWPGATAESPRGRIFIWRATALDEPFTAEPAEIVRAASGALAIATGAGLLLPREVQPENRRIMAWNAFLAGARMGPGARLGTPGQHA